MQLFVKIRGNLHVGWLRSDVPNIEGRVTIWIVDSDRSQFDPAWIEKFQTPQWRPVLNRLDWGKKAEWKRPGEDGGVSRDDDDSDKSVECEIGPGSGESSGLGVDKESRSRRSTEVVDVEKWQRRDPPDDSLSTWATARRGTRPADRDPTIKTHHIQVNNYTTRHHKTQYCQEKNYLELWQNLDTEQ